MKQIVLFLMVISLVGMVSAIDDNETNITATNITNLLEYPIYEGPPLQIENGQCVPLNATVDISSIGWNVPKIGYYGRYFDDYAPSDSIPIKTVNLPEVRRIIEPTTTPLLQTFWINPVLFAGSLGYWYQYYGDSYERAGNLRMFRVNYTCPPPIGVQEFVVSINATNFTVPKKMDWLVDKHISDIYVARGDNSMPLQTNVGDRWWLFGRTDAIYDQSTAGNLVIPSSKTENFEIGDYHIVMVSPGENNIYEAEYTDSYKPALFEPYQEAIISPFRNVTPIIITGIDPKTIEDHLKTAVRGSKDDSFYDLKLVVEGPEIQVGRIDAIKTPSNNTWYNLRGYTNMINGTVLTIQIDKEKINEKTRNIREWHTTAEGLDPGSWRQFNILFPVDYSLISPGPHDITVSAPNGAEIIVPIYIYKELPDHNVPPQFAEYFGVSPFVTPVVVVQTVTIPVPGPVQYVKVTPSDQQVKDAQTKVVNDTFWIWVTQIIGGLIGIWLAYRLVKYVISIMRRLNV